jgi:hypothetical protein
MVQKSNRLKSKPEFGGEQEVNGNIFCQAYEKD